MSSLTRIFYSVIHWASSLNKNRITAAISLFLPSQLDWIAYNDDQKNLHTSQWLEKNSHKKTITLRYKSLFTLLSSIESGHSVALLPVFFASIEKNLIQVSAVINDLKPDTWLVMNRRARRPPFIRKVSGWVIELFQNYPYFQQSSD